MCGILLCFWYFIEHHFIVSDIQNISTHTMSWSVFSPMFPSLTPRPADPLWFSVDRPVDDEADLAKEEAEHAKVDGNLHCIEIKVAYFSFLRLCKRFLAKAQT